MSDIPYYLRNPAYDDQTQMPAMMAAQPPAGMSPQVQHPMHAMIAPIGPPAPEPVPMMMGDDSQPDMHPFDTPQPKVAKQMSPIDQRESELQQGMAKKPEGGWQKFGHIAGMVGRIAGDVVAPAETELIVKNLAKQGIGPRANELRNSEMQSLEKDKSAEGLQNATAAHTQAETPEVAPNAESTRDVQGATARHLNDESAGLENPTPQFEIHDTPIGPLFVNKQTGSAQHLSVDGQPVGPKLALKESTAIIDPNDNKPHTYMIDDQGRKVVDLGVHYERPITVSTGDAGLDRESSRFAKPYEKGVADANTQLDKIADARSMVNGNAESQALGIPKVLTALVSGAGSGVRITQPELNAIAKARGISGDFEGTLNKLSGKGALTRTQQQQLTQILDDVKNRIIAKQQIHSSTLDAINGASSREQIIQADKTARQQLNELEQHGFYTGQKLPQGTVVGFSPDGKVRIDDGR